MESDVDVSMRSDQSKMLVLGKGGLASAGAYSPVHDQRGAMARAPYLPFDRDHVIRCISLKKSGEWVILVALAVHHLQYPADGRHGCHRKKTLFLSGQPRPDKRHPQKTLLYLCAEHGWGNEAVSTPKGKRIVLWSSPGFRCELVRHEGGTWLRTAFGNHPVSSAS